MNKEKNVGDDGIRTLDSYAVTTSLGITNKCCRLLLQFDERKVVVICGN